jgi:hypothetical protein
VITFRRGVRENVPLLMGLAGASGSGKTFTAMRLAKGLSGGAPFAVIDTEAGRARHYAETFTFDHADLSAQFRPATYLDAIAAADKAKYPVIVVDSMSHEWAGDGGILDWQEEEWAKNNHAEWARMSSWIKPKLAHKAMVSKLLQVRAHVILCFRAEAKIDMVKDSNGKTVIVPKEGPGGFRGWLPITEKNLPYELTASFLFMAEAPGVPIPMNLQEQHRPFFPTDRVVTEEAGQRLAEWARGGSAPSQPIPAAATPIPNPTHPATAQQPAMGTAPATPKVLADFREAIEKLGFSEAKALAFSKWDQLEGHTRPELTALYASLKAAATPQEVSL